MKKLFTAAVIAVGMFGGIAHAAVQTIRAEVNGMVCAFCAQGIEKKMRALSQTRDVYVDLKNRVVAVELKEGQSLPLDTFKGLIKDAGYDVSRVETVPETVEQIRAALRDKK